jgi:hypothetical protein
LVSPWQKLVYVVAATIFVVVLAVLIGRQLNPVAKSIVLDVAIALVWLYGIRSFRGTDEDLLAGRAWWRATARPLAGFVLTGAMAVLVILGCIDLAIGRASLTHLVVENSAGLPLYVLGVALYLNSSIRLSLSRSRKSPRPGSEPQSKARTRNPDAPTHR